MNWWADKLNGGGSYTPPPSPPRAQPQPPQQPAPAQQSARQPQSATDSAFCPSCGSANYMAAAGRVYHRCYDCGYPIQQSGSGVGATQADGPTKQAVQVKSTGYSPTTIIGKVD